MKSEANPDNAPTVRLIKIGTCPSLSGKSELTYHIGCTEDSAWLFRIVSNSSSGKFNATWVTLAEIMMLISQPPAGRPLSSATLKPLFRGRSANSPAFIFAALVAEGLLQATGDKAESYRCGVLGDFEAAMKPLIASSDAPALATAPQLAGARKPSKSKARTCSPSANASS